MNLKKILLGLGLIIFGYLTAWGVVTTFQNLSMSNLIVTCGFLIVELIILYLFAKSK